MQIPCVCEKGHHSFTANEMVQVIAAFQRGEMQEVRYVKGQSMGLVPKCLETADMEAGTSKLFTGPCNVDMPDGEQCKNPRGHREGRHGAKPRKSALSNVRGLPRAS